MAYPGEPPSAGDDGFHLYECAHRLAVLLPLDHQPIPRRATAALWRRRPAASQTQRGLIALSSQFRSEHAALPFPQIEPSARVEKGVTRPQAKIPQRGPMHPAPTEETGELLPVDVKAISEAFPAKPGTKDLIEPGEGQGILDSQHPDHHGADCAYDGTENQSPEGWWCVHPSRLQFGTPFS